MLPQRLRESAPVKKVRAFTERYERFFMPAMLLGGTALDALQFRLLSLESTFMFAGAYAAICVGAMAVLASRPARETRITRFAKLVAPFLQQFTIGALLSTSLLFYWFSGALSVSWPVIGVIALLMVSNEVLRTVFMKPVVQVGVFYFTCFSLCATLAAYTFNSIQPWTFVVGSIASLVVMAGALVVVIRIGELAHARATMWRTVAVIFALMHTAYFLNIIPPIPLSLRDAGMYHDVRAERGDYTLVGEEESLLEKLLPGQTLHIVAGEPLFAFTSVFAPTDLSTTLVHKWQRYDNASRAWVTENVLSYPMHGGRQDGYRGYSRASHVTEGKWRVSVETTRGQVLGRIPFTVEFITP